MITFATNEAKLLATAAIFTAMLPSGLTTNSMISTTPIPTNPSNLDHSNRFSPSNLMMRIILVNWIVYRTCPLTWIRLGRVTYLVSNIRWISGRVFFPDRVEQLRPRSELMGGGLSASGFGLSDDDVELGLGLGLDFMEEENSSFMFNEVEDDIFCFRNLRMNSRESVAILGNSLGSEVDEEEFQGSDLCSEEVSQLDYANTVEDGSVNLCWDSLPLVDQREADEEESEWEEVEDGGGRNEELMREFNRFLDDLENGTLETLLDLRNDEVPPERVIRWEVLLNAQNMGVGNVDLGNEDPYFSMDGYFDEDEYETMFGQFADTESDAMGKPPATKYAVENLAVVVMRQADVESNSTLCAVCKDDMDVGERAKILPCSHRYHGDCIIPWLGIRNTCPVCRFELPTDDSAYERRKTQMAGRGQ